jgi:hypothetical protein
MHWWRNLKDRSGPQVLMRSAGVAAALTILLLIGFFVVFFLQFGVSLLPAFRDGVRDQAASAVGIDAPLGVQTHISLTAAHVLVMHSDAPDWNARRAAGAVVGDVNFTNPLEKKEKKKRKKKKGKARHSFF